MPLPPALEEVDFLRSAVAAADIGWCTPVDCCNDWVRALAEPLREGVLDPFLFSVCTTLEMML